MTVLSSHLIVNYLRTETIASVSLYLHNNRHLIYLCNNFIAYIGISSFFFDLFVITLPILLPLLSYSNLNFLVFFFQACKYLCTISGTHTFVFTGQPPKYKGKQKSRNNELEKFRYVFYLRFFVFCFSLMTFPKEKKNAFQVVGTFTVCIM